MDLNSATGSFLGAVLTLLIFCTKEEGYPLETSTDDKCFFSAEMTDGLVSRRVSFKRTRRQPYHQRLQEANSHRSILSVRFTPSSIGIVKCLYDRAKRFVTKPSVISAEKKHLSSVLVSNGYPSSFVQKISKARTAPKKEPVAEFKSTAVLPYVQGLSEPLRRCLEQQGIRTVFKSETTLRSHLVRPKDTVHPVKKDGVVYRIPCECGKVYIGETGRSMHERIKEHDRDIRLARTQTSAVSEHAHKTGPYPL